MPTAVNTLETVRLRKDYPGTVALRDVSVTFGGGRIHAVLGRNGAGKSTLVKILAGAVRPTAGEVRVNGAAVALRSPHDALRTGIAAVHQELSLVPELSVAENILLGRYPRRPRPGSVRIDWDAVRSTARGILETLMVDIDVRRRISTLGVAQRQLVEIAKGMSFAPAVLMLDEPTSALAHGETDRLFRLLRDLAGRGVVILYVTHRLQEVHRIADTVTVLRNGESVGSIPVAQATPDRMAQLIFGDAVRHCASAAPVERGHPLLEVRHLSRAHAFNNISFTLHEGELLGIAGVLGSGRTELLRALFGADPPDDGAVTLGGITLRPRNPLQMVRLGMALVPENRKDEGLVQILSTRANLGLAALHRIGHHGVIRRARERRLVEEQLRGLDIRVADPEAPVASLSGGNQQKVAVGKWLLTAPRVVLFDEPTRGVDIAARQQIFQIMRALAARGVGAIVVSSELEELLEVCHRLLVFREGRIAAEVMPDAITLEQLLALCLAPHE